MDIEKFAAIREIENLKYRYVRALDTHDWTLMNTYSSTTLKFGSMVGRLVMRVETTLFSFTKTSLIQNLSAVIWSLIQK